MELLSSKIIQKKKRPVRVIQFGEGNFLRAFVDWIIQEMNDKDIYDGSVAVVQPLPGGRVASLAAQDGLYTLFMQGIENGQEVRKSKVIDVLDSFVNPYEDYQGFLGLAENPDLQIVISNTTESGIKLDENDRDLTICPNSFPGKLLALLKRRYDYFGGAIDKGLRIIPCELIDYNGQNLKSVLIALAKINDLGQDFVEWIKSANYFHNTLVDRIVPGYPKAEAAALEAEMGYKDDNIVKSETFHFWVIEADKKLSAIFPADQAGLNVLFAKDFRPYKERKVKILNGSHTAMTPVAYLGGIDFVREAMLNPLINQYVREFISQEVIPTIDLPKKEIDEFAKSVIDRYLNPFIKHELISIALNGTSKYAARILPVILEYFQDNQKLPRKCLFSLAAMAVLYRGKRGDETITLPDGKEYLDFWADAWSKYDSSPASLRETARVILGNTQLWGLDLNNLPNFTDTLAGYIKQIIEQGTLAAIKGVIG